MNKWSNVCNGQRLILITRFSHLISFDFNTLLIPFYDHILVELNVYNNFLCSILVAETKTPYLI